MSVANYVETAAMIDSARDPVVSRQLDNLITKAGLALVPVTIEQGKIARAAYRDFGRGSGHPAELNFGDCFAYALAKQASEPLLLEGNDLIHTDVVPAERDVDRD
jgi:ribonuclease VapC